VTLIPQKIITKNRSVGNRLPVFLAILTFSLTVFSLFSVVNPVSGETQVFLSKTQTKTSPDLKLPDSGEPVILQPGDNARIVSPLILSLLTRPGEDGFIRIDLIGQDNRLIFRKLMDYRSYKSQTLLIEEKISFEIRKTESARLQVVLEDKKGRTTFVSSINLTLLGVRGNENPGDPPTTPHFLIDAPDLSAPITGKTLSLKSSIKPANTNAVIVELIGEDGHTMVSRLVQIAVPNDQTARVVLNAELPFKVTSPTEARLRIRQESNSMIKGTVMLWSQKITLGP
jgi:hypothetical protein